MAASDAKVIAVKNAALRIPIGPFYKTDGTIITSWTTPDSERSLDGAAFADCTNEATEIGTTGLGYLDLTASETNADMVWVKVTIANADAVPYVVPIMTAARSINDLAYPATSGRSLAVDASGQVTVGALAAAVITAASIATDAITAAKIAANAITSSEIADGAITAGKLAGGAITAAKFGASAIDSAALATSAVEEIRDAVLAATLAELTGAADAPSTPTLAKAIMLLYMAMRNGVYVDQATAEVRIRNDAGTTILEAVVDKAATHFDRGKLGAPD